MEVLKGIGTGCLAGLFGFLATFVWQFGLGVAGGFTFGFDPSMWPLAIQILGSNAMTVISTTVFGFIIFRLIYKRY